MIYRSQHSEGFTRIDNAIARSTDMSPVAFRILVYMLSCADGWEFSVKGIAYALGLPERKTKAAVAELKKLGYIVQNLQKGEHGHFLPSAWDVYEDPTAVHKNGTPVKVNARREYTKTGVQVDGRAVPRACGKPHPIRTNNIKELTIYKEEHDEKKAHVEKCQLGSYENVFLTNDEQKELCDSFGLEKTVGYIERLSEYLHSHPSKFYPNHKATIEKWINDDEGGIAT